MPALRVVAGPDGRDEQVREVKLGDPADVDTCLILGAGYPFFLGGITRHLDDHGISERVCGSTFAAGATRTAA